jgi:hypothetical protein
VFAGGFGSRIWLRFVSFVGGAGSAECGEAASEVVVAALEGSFPAVEAGKEVGAGGILFQDQGLEASVSGRVDGFDWFAEGGEAGFDALAPEAGLHGSGFADAVAEEGEFADEFEFRGAERAGEGGLVAGLEVCGEGVNE